MKLTVAAIQMASRLGRVSENMAVAESLLGKIKGRPGVAVLPELALTGYAFESFEAIKPYLEPQNGASCVWAKQMAEKYDLNVCIGYPEIANGVVYNSAVLCSPTGKTLMHYRKTHLYSTDIQWGCEASPDGFTAAGPWPELPVKTQIGICMDLNPKDFVAPWNAYEFAKSVTENRSGLVLFPTAWLAGEKPENELDKELVAYWRARLPIDVPIVIANRCGKDGTVEYGGSSTIFYAKQAVSVAGQGIVEREITI